MNHQRSALLIGCGSGEQREVPAVVSGSKLLVSDAETERMERAGSVTRRLLDLIDGAVGVGVDHAACRRRHQEVAQDLADARLRLRQVDAAAAQPPPPPPELAGADDWLR